MYASSRPTTPFIPPLPGASPSANAPVIPPTSPPQAPNQFGVWPQPATAAPAAAPWADVGWGTPYPGPVPLRGRRNSYNGMPVGGGGPPFDPGAYTGYPAMPAMGVYPGATPAERISDRQRSRLILERTMRSVDACAALISAEDDLDEGLKQVDSLISQTEGTTPSSATEIAELAYARTALAKENLSMEAVREIAQLADDELNYVQLSELFRDPVSGSPDFVRS